MIKRKRSSFRNWFYRTWQLMHLSDSDSIAINWTEFQEALEEAYNAGVRKGKLNDQT